MADLDSRVCATDGTTLAVTTWGDAPASIVLIHGFADARYVWSPFARSLMNHAGVLAMDLRGHGDSDWDLDGTYCVDTFVADVQTILDRLCSPHLVLVGHSLGAEIAIRLAAADERRIRALVLVDGGPGTVAEGVEQARARFSSRMRTFVSRGDYQRTLRDWLPMADSYMVRLSAQQAIKQFDDGYRLKCDPRLAQMAPPDADSTLWSLFESLRCPSLLIRAEASAVVMRRTANEMVRRGADVRCESVAMAGHAVMMDNPKALDSVLQGFVADLYRGTADVTCQDALRSSRAAS